MSNSIEKAVYDYLESIKHEGVIKNNFEVVYIGEKLRDEWEHDLWIASFGEQSFEFKTGLGLRKKPSVGSFSTQQAQTVPVKPTAASVLHSLLLDSQAIDESYNDWCDNFGYDNDCISHFNTYQDCCKNAEKLKKVFSNSQIEKLNELLEEY